MKKNYSFKAISKIIAFCGVVYVVSRIVSGTFGLEDVGVGVITLAFLVI